MWFRFKPIMVAYQWVSVFLCLLIFPILWYVLYYVINDVVTTIVTQFPSVYSGKWADASSIIMQIWYWLPAIILIPMFVWAVMETLKERRRRHLL